MAQPWRVLPIFIDYFINRINKPGARYAFESSFHDSITRQIGLTRLKLIKDIPPLVISGKNDKLTPTEHSKLFKEGIRNDEVEIIGNAQAMHHLLRNP